MLEVEGEEARKFGWGVKLSFRPQLGLPYFANWKLRRFELTQTQFRYSDETGIVKGTILRSSIIFAETILLSDLPHMRGNLIKYYPCPLRVWVGQTPFFLSFATSQQRETWLKAINNASYLQEKKNLIKIQQKFQETSGQMPVNYKSQSSEDSETLQICFYLDDLFPTNSKPLNCKVTESGTNQKCSRFSL